jgi:hypothetical protein
MPRVDFGQLPDHARLWVFPATRDLSASEAVTCLETVDDFLTGWAAHGVPLVSGRELRDRRFLLVAVDVDAEAPSGCSIDALVNRLRALGSELGVDLIDHGPVWFREAEAIRCVPRPDFRKMVGEGLVQPEARVFDTTLTSLRQLKEGGLERAASDTWHGRTFFKQRVGG